MDERVAQYLRLYYCLFQTTVYTDDGEHYVNTGRNDNALEQSYDNAGQNEDDGENYVNGGQSYDGAGSYEDAGQNHDRDDSSRGNRTKTRKGAMRGASQQQQQTQQFPRQQSQQQPQQQQSALQERRAVGRTVSPIWINDAADFRRRSNSESYQRPDLIYQPAPLQTPPPSR